MGGAMKHDNTHHDGGWCPYCDWTGSCLFCSQRLFPE